MQLVFTWYVLLMLSSLVYRADMPKWLPFQDIYRSLVQGIAQKLQRWLHLWFVVFIWLYILPVCTCKLTIFVHAFTC